MGRLIPRSERERVHKCVQPGETCPECGEGEVSHTDDKDEGQFTTRITGCPECEWFWKYPVVK